MPVTLDISRVNALPASLAPSTMYITKSTTPGLVDLHFTSLDGLTDYHVLSKDEVDAAISSALSAFAEIGIVANIAARDAMVLTRNELVLVLDATGDSTVHTGAAVYVYAFGSSVWYKVSEFESLDIVPTWDSLQGKPASTPAAIDAAVVAAHSHGNKPFLDQIGEDANQNLTYRGQSISGKIVLASAEW